jgi:phosphopantothenoylcysteine decarboxylase/phosphopantothenate--cysteine ligase
MRSLEGKHIVLGVSGSIACYKAVDLASRLTQGGALVDVIMTESATRFVTPLTFRNITHRPVVTDAFDLSSEMSLQHVVLAERADVIVVAPATANALAKFAHGLADDALSMTVLASRAPVLVAPAMDGYMWQNPATFDNATQLIERGFTIVGPAEGRMASGLFGLGRLVEPAEMVGHITALLGRTGDLAGRKVVVSAGGTQEPIDPVRVVANRSSGKMGYAVAEAARDRGATVILVAAPTALDDPAAIEMVRVGTALQMHDAVLQHSAEADALVMAAAVADYRPKAPADQKVKKKTEGWMLELAPTPDILAAASRPGLISVGFAAESQSLVEHARGKLQAKGLHLIVANDITDPDSGFGVDTNRVTFLDRNGLVEEMPLLTKYEVAHQILDRVFEWLG